jgi:hypothetical protein
MSAREGLGLTPLVVDLVVEEDENTTVTVIPESGKNFSEKPVETPAPAPTPAAGTEQLTSSDYYWNSYAHFGIHEVPLSNNKLLHIQPTNQFLITFLRKC